MEGAAELERGRRSYAGEAWADAYEALSAADRSEPLGARDLERLATAAYMIGRDSQYLEVLERAHGAHLESGEPLAAVRCAFWIGVNLARAGEMGPASGWLGRAHRLLERQGGDEVERGYLLLPRVFELAGAGDREAAAATAGEAAEIGERLGDPDLFALATHEQGHILVSRGRPREGLALLDEAMVAVTAGELSPIVSGIVYCGVILACQDAQAVSRAREWTEALTRWCARQPDLVAFTGRCLIHRAEIMQLGGAWPEALEEARRAGRRCLESQNELAAGEACYREGEIQRMLGRFDAAEESYREASRRGWEPQPGFALLRLAQGNAAAAQAAIRRAESESAEMGRRATVLPAFVEIMLATGDVEAARGAGEELEAIAAEGESEALEATAAYARGAVELARDDARAALVALRGATRRWQALEAPYEAARSRHLLGLACRALGDEDTATLELEAARATLEELGAAPELARLGSPAADRAGEAHGLTGRELEVLRHVAAGATNRAIAAELVLSVRTIDRHVSNIFAKLGVSTRAAATAYAHEHGLV